MRYIFKTIFFLLITLSLITILLALPIYLRFFIGFGLSVIIIIFILIPSGLYHLYKSINCLPIKDFIKQAFFLALIITISILLSKSIGPIEKLAALHFYNNSKMEIQNLVNYAEEHRINYAIKEGSNYMLYTGLEKQKIRIENNRFIMMLQEMKIHAFGSDDNATYVNLYKSKFPCFGLGFVTFNKSSKWNSHFGTSCPVAEIYKMDGDWSYYYFLD